MKMRFELDHLRPLLGDDDFEQFVADFKLIVTICDHIDEWWVEITNATLARIGPDKPTAIQVAWLDVQAQMSEAMRQALLSLQPPA